MERRTASSGHNYFVRKVIMVDDNCNKQSALKTCLECGVFLPLPIPLYTSKLCKNRNFG